MSVNLTVNLPGQIEGIYFITPSVQSFSREMRSPADQFMDDVPANLSIEISSDLDNPQASLINRGQVVNIPQRQLSHYETIDAVVVGSINGCWACICSVLAGGR